MSARGYELDEALRQLKEQVRRNDLKAARVRPATGVSFTDPGGFTPPLTGPDLQTVIQELLVLIAAAGGLDSVTDGTTTVTPASALSFTEDATVTDLGGGVVGVAIFGGMVPYLIASGDVFTVPLYKQALKAMPITVDGTLVVDGYLIEVN